MTSTNGISVLVVDDEETVRTAVVQLLCESLPTAVITQAANGAEAIEQFETHPSDIVLMDLRMPVMDGVEATRRITTGTAKTAVLVHSAYGEDSLVLEALQAGARGFSLKGSPACDLVATICNVASGRAHISDEITRPVIDRLVRALADERKTRIAAEEAAAKTTELAERQRRFAVQAAHELRTPLTILLGNLELLTDDGLNADDRNQAVKAAIHGAHRLQDRAENLEATASIDEISLSMQHVEARTAVDHVIEQLQCADAVRNEVQPRTQLMTDGVRLGQVLKNIVQNAISASPRYEPVIVRSSRDGNRVHIDVIDSGPGFDPDVLPRVFEAFAQGADPASGLGVGLTVARSLVTKMGGDISAKNNESGGATVSLILPGLAA